jgi:hypothetical protein
MLCSDRRCGTKDERIQKMKKIQLSFTAAMLLFSGAVLAQSSGLDTAKENVLSGTTSSAEAFERVEGQTPEKAQQGIQKAREASQRGGEQALGSLERERGKPNIGSAPFDNRAYGSPGRPSGFGGSGAGGGRGRR